MHGGEQVGTWFKELSNRILWPNWKKERAQDERQKVKTYQWILILGQKPCRLSDANDKEEENAPPGQRCAELQATARESICAGMERMPCTAARGLLQTHRCLPGLRDLGSLASHGRNLRLGVHTPRSPAGWLPQAPAAHDTLQSWELHSTEFLRSIARIWLRTFLIRYVVWSPAAVLVHCAAR